MNLLVVGGGGREHALCWKLAQSPRLTRLVAAPGNPGIARHGACAAVSVDDQDGLVRLAEQERADLIVVGPEAPLVAGLADRLRDKGFTVFGPGAAAAALEGSKAFAKDLMARAGIPTARYATFTDAARARAFCRELGVPVVVKADGLAAGKGAIVCATLAEACAARKRRSSRFPTVRRAWRWRRRRTTRRSSTGTAAPTRAAWARSRRWRRWTRRCTRASCARSSSPASRRSRARARRTAACSSWGSC
jgi:phosphoribosylaminoimidazole carboxylase (NCAIR synthetase)